MLEGFEFNWILFGVVLLTWVIFILGVAQLSRFYLLFNKSRKDFSNNMDQVNANLRKLQAALSEVTIEQRRLSRLTLEQVDLKKAELTGDFEIVDEPIETALEQAPAPKKLEI